MPKPPRRAIIYCRISRDILGTGLGVERQEADCRNLAQQLGLEVVRVHTDNDTSAYKGKRRGYEAVLKDLKAGAAEVLISWHNDRLHRQPRELEDFIDIVEKHRVEVHFVRAGQIDLTTPSGRLHARQMGSFARYESEHRSERVAAARKQQAEQGRWGGGARPFGWNSDGVTPHPVEAPAIRAAVDLLLHGGSLRAATRLLNDRGLTTTKTGAIWEPFTTKQMLMRPRNAAIAVYRGQIQGDGNWEPVIGRDEWVAVCDLLSRPGRRTSPGNTPRWLGSLLFKCMCGETLVVGTSGRVNRPSYRCKGTRRGGKYHVTRSAIHLDAYVETMLLRRVSRGDLAELFAAEPEPGVDVAAIRRRITALEHNRHALGRRLALPDGDPDKIMLGTFDEYNRAAHTEITALEAQLASATISSPVMDLVSADDPEEVWETYGLEQRRAVVRELMTVTVHPQGSRGGKFDPDTIEIAWHLPTKPR